MCSSAVRIKQTSSRRVRSDELSFKELQKVFEPTLTAIHETAASATTENIQKLINDQKQRNEELDKLIESTEAAIREKAAPSEKRKIYKQVEQWSIRVRNNDWEAILEEPRSKLDKPCNKPRKFKPNTSTFCYNDWTHARTLRSAGSKRPNEGV